MIVTTAQLFKIAYGKYAVGAYNINNLEQTVGLFKGNVQSKAPFIIQLSQGARKYTDKRYLEAMIRTSQEVFPDAIFAVHLDHGDEQTCYDCIASGFYSSVMIDASHEPFDKNVEITKRVVDKAHARGRVGRSRTGHAGRRRGRHRRPRFPHRSRRGEDICRDRRSAIPSRWPSAPAMALTNSRPNPAEIGLHFDVIEKIQKLLPGVPMVMHGSSSVPKDEVDRINKAGGKMEETSGVTRGRISPRPPNSASAKVNIDTDGRLVWTRVHREFFRDHPGQVRFPRSRQDLTSKSTPK